MVALREKVLRKKVEKLEVKGLQKYKLIPEHLSVLEKLLHDVFVIHRPKESDYHNRRDLVRVFNEIAKELYGRDNCPAVKVFGSFLMDLFSCKSDLDLSVNFSSGAAEFPRDKKIKTLRKFAKKFYALQRRGHILNVQPIMTARVPILKVVDAGTRIECDISVENKDGILKSQIIKLISSIDERFQKLCFLMKAWAKAQNINSSKDKTMNSLSIILLVAFHFQTRDPPILPPFSVLFKDGTNSASVSKLVKRFLDYGKGNKESLAMLFITLLIKLSSVSTLWCKGLCASTFQGAWISKTWDSKVGCISVEDFTDRSQNVARAVGEPQVKKINKCIELSIQYVFDFLNGLIEEPKLRGFLFGREEKLEMPNIPLAPSEVTRIQSPEVSGGRYQIMPCNATMTRGTQASLWHQVMPSDDPTLTKKMRTTGGWGEKPTESWVAASSGSWVGTSTGYYGETHPLTTPPSVDWGWGGMQPAISAGPISSKEKRLIEGWGNSQQFHPNSSIGLRTTSGPRLHPAFVSHDRSMEIDRLGSRDQEVAAPPNKDWQRGYTNHRS